MMSNDTNYDQQNKPTLRVLVDMDGVLADYEGHLLQEFRKCYPDDPFVALEDRRNFNAWEDYEKLGSGLVEKVRHIERLSGFFLSMEEVDGAVSAVKEMSGLSGVKVFICSTPLRRSQHCAQEKLNWLMQHLGEEWADKLILTRDKTLVAADLLIDDKPLVTGCMKPKWEHILFRQCHNVHADTNANQRRQENWTDGSWKYLIEEYKRKLFIR